jgi:hypothetical protein
MRSAPPPPAHHKAQGKADHHDPHHEVGRLKPQWQGNTEWSWDAVNIRSSDGIGRSWTKTQRMQPDIQSQDRCFDDLENGYRGTDGEGHHQPPFEAHDH